MKVRILTSIGGSPSYQPGDVADLDERIASVWVREGIAEAVTSNKAAAENAMQPASKAR